MCAWPHYRQRIGDNSEIGDKSAIIVGDNAGIGDNFV
jgi:acetyltransferase-like isoleucine patch superfamily enzyme